MRVLLCIQPPRCYWPHTSEGDNLLQQALPALAAVAQQEGHEIKVIDCMPLHIGWRSFQVRRGQSFPAACDWLRRESRTLCIRVPSDLFDCAEKPHPSTITVAGGGHFTNLAHRYATHPDIDIICIGEGELTFANILAAIEQSTPIGAASMALHSLRTTKWFRLNPQS